VLVSSSNGTGAIPHPALRMCCMATKKLPSKVLEYFRKQGARGGKIGGKRSMDTMTPRGTDGPAREAKRSSNSKAPR
jgi:hypothetical protein